MSRRTTSDTTWRTLVPIATIVSNVLSYVLFLVSARLLDRATYGETLSLLNPLTYVVNAERALFNGDIANTSVLGGAIAAIVVAILGLYIGVRAMKPAN